MSEHDAVPPEILAEDSAAPQIFFVSPVAVEVGVVSRVRIYGTQFTPDMELYLIGNCSAMDEAVPIKGTALVGLQEPFRYLSESEIEITILSTEPCTIDMVTKNDWGIGIWSNVYGKEYSGLFITNAEDTHDIEKILQDVPIYKGITPPAIPTQSFDNADKQCMAMVCNGWKLIISANHRHLESYDFEGELVNHRVLQVEPTAFAYDHTHFFAACMDGVVRIFCLDWQHLYNLITLPERITSMCWYDGELWATSITGKLYIIDIVDESYRMFNLGVMIAVGLVVLEDRILVASANGMLIALDKINLVGLPIWVVDTQIENLCDMVHDPVNSRLWFLTENGEVYQTEVDATEQE